LCLKNPEAWQFQQDPLAITSALTLNTKLQMIPAAICHGNDCTKVKKKKSVKLKIHFIHALG